MQVGRPLLAAMAAGCVAAAGLVAAGSEGFSAARVVLASGQAWVASAGVGQIALIDGSTEDRVAAVTAGRPGRGISVVQAGPDALVVDAAAGTVRRVRGSTYDDAPGAVTPLPGGGALQVYGGAGASVFAVDGRQGSAVVLDRDTMQPVGRPVSLAARLDPRSTVLDAEGRLWAVDGSDGDVVRIDRSGKRVAEDVTSPGVSPLVLVRGEPAVVDLGDRSVALLDPGSGERGDEACLGAGPDAAVRVGGSSSRPLLYTVVPESGDLLVSDLATGDCSGAVRIADPGSRLGDPVEAGGRVFVPDYGQGTVIVADPAAGSVIGTARVLPAGVDSFELLPRDGYVFYNDPATERAGVVRLDATVRQVQKYDRGNPTEDVRRPVRDTGTGADDPGGDGSGAGGGTGRDGDAAGTGEGDGEDQGERESSERPRKPTKPEARPKPPSQPQLDAGGPHAPAGPPPAIPGRIPPPPGQAPSPGQLPPPGRLPPPGGQPPPGQQPSPGRQPGQATIRIVAAPPYETGRPIPFSVESSTGAPVTAARWTFDQATAAEGVRVTHAFATAGDHYVQVVATVGGVDQPPAGNYVTVTDPAAPPNVPPVISEARFDPETGGRAPLDATLHISAHDPDRPGAVLTYAVQWGDGQPDTVQTSATGSVSLPHGYTGAGTFPVVVSVSDASGGAVSSRRTYTVDPPPANQPPTVRIDVNPKGGTAPLAVQATATGSDPDGDPLQYSFVWSDGREAPWSDRAFDARDDLAAGTWNVTVKVRDPAGAQAVDGYTFTVQPRDDPPTIPDLVWAKNTVDVDEMAEVDATSASADTVRWTFEWSTGYTDVNTTGRSRASSRFTGERSVTVTVEDAAGQRATRTESVTVVAPVHGEGTLTGNNNSFGFDLDTGTNGDSGADVVIGSDGTPDVYVVQFGRAGRGAPFTTWNGCLSEYEAGDLLPDPVRVTNGTDLCVHTTQGRLARVVIGPGPGVSSITYTTWAPVKP